MAILTVVTALTLLTAVGYAAEEDRVDVSGQWEYILENGCVTITWYFGKENGDLAIPSELDRYAVTGIGVDDPVFPEDNSDDAVREG